MRSILIVLLIAFATQAGADGVKSWKVVSSSVFSVLPTWLVTLILGMVHLLVQHLKVLNLLFVIMTHHYCFTF